jgi:hypothetical protein
MNALLEVEDHPLPPDTWGEAPQTPLVLSDGSSPTSFEPTTVPPAVAG